MSQVFKVTTPAPLPPGPYVVERHIVGWVVHDSTGRIIASTDDRIVADGIARLPELLRERGETTAELAPLTMSTLHLLSQVFSGACVDLHREP